MAELAPNTTLEIFIPCQLPRNPEVNASKEIHLKISEIINGPLSGAIVIQGIIVNCLCLAAFFSHIRPRPSIYHYLIALCFWDIALLFVAGFMCSFPTLLFGNQFNSPAYIPTYLWSYYFAGVTLVGCVWTIVALSGDRYLSICYPFRYRFFKKKTIIKMLVMVAASATIYCTPRMFEMEIGKCNNSETYEIENDLQTTSLKSHSGYLIVYKIAGGLLLISLGPYLLLLYFSIRISAELRSSISIRSTATLTTKQQVDSSNRILMGLVIKFLCCYLPITILDICEMVVSEDTFYSSTLITMIVAFSNFLVAFNSGTNFWMYVISSPLFRRACGRVLRGYCGPEQYTLKAAGILLSRMADTNAMFIHRASMKTTSNFGSMDDMNTELINGNMMQATSKYGTMNSSRIKRTAVQPSLNDSPSNAAAAKKLSCHTELIF